MNIKFKFGLSVLWRWAVIVFPGILILEIILATAGTILHENFPEWVNAVTSNGIGVVALVFASAWAYGRYLPTSINKAPLINAGTKKILWGLLTVVMMAVGGIGGMILRSEMDHSSNTYKSTSNKSLLQDKSGSNGPVKAITPPANSSSANIAPKPHWVFIIHVPSSGVDLYYADNLITYRDNGTSKQGMVQMLTVSVKDNTSSEVEFVVNCNDKTWEDYHIGINGGLEDGEGQQSPGTPASAAGQLTAILCNK